jgi:Mannosyl-glycoprotein endo-beta-N-acetylglucosaminidase
MISMATAFRTIGRSARVLAAAALANLSTAAVALGPQPASGPPVIRMDGTNRVPACVTPDKLMQFMRSRNANLDPRFRDIAALYKKHGEGWRVRWDYAFYQMLIETNFLTFRAPSGRMGDVNPAQNNFAGIGTTGGGVPGDRFPDVSTGVLAQIQHLVAYSGERLAQPTAPRTQLKQDVILAQSLALNRPVTFADLSGRWAADKQYGKSIEWVAKGFRDGYCR